MGASTVMQGLPEGFELDTAPAQSSGLPEGFELDDEPGPQRGNAASRAIGRLGNINLPVPEGTNPLHRFFSDVADAGVTSAGDTPLDRVVQGGAHVGKFFTDPGAFQKTANTTLDVIGGVGEAIAEDPLQTLVLDPLAQPGIAIDKLGDASQAVFEGRFGDAGRDALESGTAVLETGLLLAPGATVAKTAGKEALKEGAEQAGKQLLDDTARVGVDVTAPVAFPQTAGAAAKQLSENLGAGITTRDGADRVLGQLEAAVKRQVDDLSPGASLNDAGAAAREGAARFNSKSLFTPDEASTITQPAKFSTFRDKAEALYNKAYRRFDAETIAPTTSTAEKLSEVTSRFSNEELGDLFSLPVAKKLDGIIGGSEISIADMRALRTEIRDIQNGSKILKSRDDAALERLEGALTQDIYAAVESAGGKTALQGLKRADKFYRLGSERVRRALEPFLKDKATDETAAQAILRATKGQGKGDIQRLRALRRSLKPDEMDDISAGILREMGKAKEGADFSPEVFANAWKSMGDDAKAVLFNRAQRPEVRQNIDALARVIERQASVEKLSNRSRSGANLQNVSTVVGLYSAPITTASLLLGANGFGRAMMSPEFTKLLLRLQRNAPRATREGANALQEKARVLALIGAAEQSDAAIKPYTTELRAAINSANDNPQLRSQATPNQPELQGQ